MTIRLLYLTREPHPSFRPDIATLFGRHLPRHGVHSDLVALQDGEQKEWPCGTAFTRKANGKFGRLWHRMALACSLFRRARGGCYDAIQVRDRIGGALIGLLAARWHGLPFYYWMSFPFVEFWQDVGAGREAPGSSRLRRLLSGVRGSLGAFVLYRIVLPRADHVFVQSDAMRAKVAALGIDPAAMTPVPMGVTVPEQLDHVTPSDDPRLAGRKVVMYLGALERMRHPEVMVEAMVEVVRREPQALLVLVGDSQTPGDRAWLEQQVQRCGVQDHVLITGWMAPADAYRYLRAAIVGLSPIPCSRVLELGTPTKVCEYLAYGLPVVANGQPDQATLLEQTGGGLCVPLSAEGFAEGILAMLADPQRARMMAEQGRARIGQLRSYDVLGEQLAAQYRRLLGRSAGHGAACAAPQGSAP
jgi:glycosyltransferase involved in cell wall biosynthesis